MLARVTGNAPTGSPPLISNLHEAANDIVVYKVEVHIHIKDDIFGMSFIAVGAIGMFCFYLVAWLYVLRVEVSKRVTFEGTSNSKLTSDAFVGWTVQYTGV